MASVAALFNGGRRARQLSGGWWPDPTGRLTYRYIGRAGDDIVVSLGPAAVSHGTGVADLAGQWRAVEAMSPLTIDVLLAILAQTGAVAAADRTPGTPERAVAITARAILRCKGLEKWGAEGAALRRRVDAEVLRLQALRFTARAGAAAAFPGADRLFEIVGARPAKMTRGTGGRETVWLIRPGRWAREEADGDAGPAFAALPRALLQLDHRANRGSDVLAKKLGVRAALLWGGTLPAGPLRRRVYNLLAELGELPRPACRGGRWGARVRQRLSRAIELLQEMGLLGAVAWPAGFEPGCRARPKGWVAPWLSSTIVLNGAAAFGVRDSAAGEPVRAMPPAGQATAKLAALHRGSVIRALRTDRNIPQSRLARELGVSAAYLSQIENEHRMASPAVLGRVAGWLARHRAGEPAAAGADGAIAALGSAGARLELTDIGRPAGKDDRT